TALVNTKILIPANTKAHTESKSQVMKRDVLLYSLLPHSHFRGVASNFVAYYPDGSEEVLLSVPAYDFNWQTSYILEEPKKLPAGTKVVHSTTWDNSAQNPANPDPNRDVPWGQQSWDEMLFGAMSFRYLDEVESDSAVGVAQFQGTAGSE
ncbi:MAG: alkyl hydroperoxide reductase, partial [Gammaproteobacteria bacterium]|nr:alkyl hydroperoxide reductase [Gammaproteobacteria bacterium]